MPTFMLLFRPNKAPGVIGRDFQELVIKDYKRAYMSWSISMAKAGVLKFGSGFLPPSHSARLTFYDPTSAEIASAPEFGTKDGITTTNTQPPTASTATAITHGPFHDVDDLNGSICVISVSSLEAALDLGKGCPVFLNGATMYVRELSEPEDLTAAGKGEIGDLVKEEIGDLAKKENDGAVKAAREKMEKEGKVKRDEEGKVWILSEE